jgi:O-antigen/teichoic acid export membrane protein
LVLLTLSLILWGFHAKLLHHFGSNFDQGQPVLLAIMLSYFFCATVRGMPKFRLYFGEKQLALARLTMVVAILHFALSLILIPLFDYYGAACALIIADVTYAVALLILFKRHVSHLRPLSII